MFSRANLHYFEKQAWQSRLGKANITCFLPDLEKKHKQKAEGRKFGGRSVEKQRPLGVTISKCMLHACVKMTHYFERE